MEKLNKLEKVTIKTLGPLRLSALLKRAERLVTKYRNHSARSVLETKRDIAVASFPEAQRFIVKSMLNNQIGHLMAESVGKSSSEPYSTLESKEFIFDTAVHAIKGYLLLSNIVSVQPIGGPVGVAHQLRYVYKPENKVALEIVSQSLETSSTRYASEVSVEAYNDFQVSIPNAATEYAQILGSELAHEIVNDTIFKLCRAAPKHENRTDGGDAITEINRAAADIAHKTRRGVANFLVMNTITWHTLREQIPETWVDTADPLNPYGMAYGGKIKINGYYDVYVMDNAELSDYKVLVGYIGKAKTESGEPSPINVDTGIVVSPFVPVVSAGVIINPDSFAPVIKLLNRAGITSNDSYPIDRNSDAQAFLGKNYYKLVDLSSYLGTEK